ncbi:MAG: hypothetical protein EOM14_04555 [Clostridia bacterium]|nr:hypothetical protein [Clostridia bacterium]
MSIGINGYASTASVLSTINTTAAKDASAALSEENTNVSAEDTIQISEEGREKAKGLTSEEVKQLMDEQEAQIEKFKLMLQRMIGKQVQTEKLALESQSDVQSAAAASIAEGGEYSVDAVATRILSMASALAGGDASKIETLREAVIEGFRQVAGMFGADTDSDNWISSLPQVSQDTYSEIMSRFDSWASAAGQDPTEE